LNIRTEHLDDHTARMVVEFDAERLTKAKQRAAQRISNKVNIPGFRKGKAPYRIVANYVGEPAIVEDAVDLITNEIYKEALEQSTLAPYGPGTLETYDVAETPVFTFRVPLQPIVDLKDYRSVRSEWTAPVTTDDDLNRTLKGLQIEHAVIETSQRPAAMGDRVTLDIHSHIEPSESEEAAEAQDYIHDHDAQILLDTDDDIAPGFSPAIVGAEVDENRTFTLTLPETDARFAGRSVHFEVKVKQIENVTLPALTDDFAARVTQDEEKPLTLLELRIRIRENLEKSALARAEEDYANKALTAMIEQAEVAYPEMMVADQVERLLQRFDQRLRESRFTLQDYMRIYGKTIDDLYEDYRPAAERILRHGLVLREIGRVEQIEVGDTDLTGHIDELVERVREEERTQARQLFDNEYLRDSLREDMTRNRVMERVAAIARGDAPELPVSTAVSEASE
jgi:trigger factor